MCSYERNPDFEQLCRASHSGLAVNMVARSATAAITITSFSTTQIFALHLEYPPRRDLRGRRGLKSNGGGLWPRKISPHHCQHLLEAFQVHLSR
jgi:hypothetical protein